MTYRKISSIVFAFGILSGTAFAANFSGKWSLTLSQGRGRSNVILVLNQVGNTVTGTLSPAGMNASSGAPQSNDIIDPKIEGDTLSFYVWRGSDQPVKQIYKGTMSGDEINFTVTGGSQQFLNGGGMTEPSSTQAKAVRTQ